MCEVAPVSATQSIPELDWESEEEFAVSRTLAFVADSDESGFGASSDVSFAFSVRLDEFLPPR